MVTRRKPAGDTAPVAYNRSVTLERKEILNLEEFEQHIRVRPVTLDDYDVLRALDLACYPDTEPVPRDQLASQVEVFPAGQLCIEYDGEIVAASSSLIVDFDNYDEWHNWQEISDDGYIRNHDPEGDTLYGIEIMVHPEFRGLKLARRLYNARKELAREMNLPHIIICGRIPGYGEYADEMTAPEYVQQVMQKNLFDPVLTAQVANGFVLQRLIPGYLPEDDDSRGYATFLKWNNLEYQEQRSRQFRAVSLVRICVVQYDMRRVDSFDEFATQVAYFTDVGSDYRSDFVVFPELVTTQLLPQIKAQNPAQAARLLAEFTPQYLDLFTELAVKYNVNIIGGSQFTIEGDRLYNVSYLFRRNGTIGKQYKLHVTPSERRWWGVTPGDRVNVFETDRGRIAILICYDVEFPELARIVTARKANILFVPFNTDERYGYLRVRSCAQARAIENEIYVAIAGCTGNLPFVANADIHYAQSGIYTPADISFARDAVASECTPNVETLIVHDVDIELLRRQRMRGTVRTWSDRRPELYGVRYSDPDLGDLEY